MGLMASFSSPPAAVDGTTITENGGALSAITRMIWSWFWGVTVSTTPIYGSIGESSGTNTEASAATPVPACTVKKMRCRLQQALVSGVTVTFRVRKNGDDTDLVIVFDGTDGANAIKTVTADAVFADGDTLTLVGTRSVSGSGASVQFTLEVER